jgi:hypothetical protein
MNLRLLLADVARKPKSQRPGEGDPPGRWMLLR